MTARNFFSLLILIIGGGLLLSFVNMNSTPVELNIWGVPSLGTYSLGITAVGVFFLGVLATSVVGLYFRFFSFLRERTLVKEVTNAQKFYSRVCEARNATASQQWSRARSLWETLLKKDPSDCIARIELSRCIEKEGDPREALKILTPAKTSNPKNLEVLFRAAELNIAMENKTAAVDNLDLILSIETNRYAAELAMQLSEELGRYDDALEYYSILENSSFHLPEDGKRIRLQRMLVEHEHDITQLTKELTYFAKKQKYAPAYEELAKLSIREGDEAKTIDYLQKALSISESIVPLRTLVELESAEKVGTDKVVTALQSIGSNQTGKVQVYAHLALARLLCKKEAYAEAVAVLEGIDKLSVDAHIAKDDPIVAAIALTKAYLAQKNNENQNFTELEKLVSFDVPLSWQEKQTAMEMSTQGNQETVSSL